MAGDGIKTYKKLRVWSVADRLAHEVYRATKAFPEHERYGLTSQLRRAALSIPTNLAEGQARSRRELKQFASIALGSLAEVEYLLEFAHQETLLTSEEYARIEGVRSEVGVLLWSFCKAL